MVTRWDAQGGDFVDGAVSMMVRLKVAYGGRWVSEAKEQMVGDNQVEEQRGPNVG